MYLSIPLALIITTRSQCKAVQHLAHAARHPPSPGMSSCPNLLMSGAGQLLLRWTH
ncbi:hypothetical protein PAXRUDRAFT_551537 [Paxillus rubicundulus Ve08.2h10]|uniref:Uncharacterized protein n=1 Tax=Paxillus rubicundulus Ve08.2h10 TaxID=930991 RepID=A0A0D0BS41_9AGAM|nr:hypothetical protein PAXRUDRAFT_551537 [Paxillus rubicundulus Ve08.2h10]